MQADTHSAQTTVGILAKSRLLGSVDLISQDISW